MIFIAKLADNQKDRLNHKTCNRQKSHKYKLNWYRMQRTHS